MARRTHLTAALALLLGPVIAGCAATAPPSAVRAPDQPVNLEGVSTEYSVRLDQIQASAQSNANQRMPSAVVAREKVSGAVVVASLHRSGTHYTLDLILHNHGLDAIELPRARVRLYDQSGLQLKQIVDWDGAANVGLRAGLRNQEQDQEQMITDDLSLAAMLDSNEGITTGPTGRTQKSSSQDPNQRTGTTGPLLTGPSLSRVSEGRDEIVAPEMLRVEPETSEPYWVYWDSEGQELAMPLTAVVQLGERGLLFRFDAPTAQ